MKTKSKDEFILELEETAKNILALKSDLGLRRPLVIEFCGTPKAGKTTTINILNNFLKRNDFKTIIIGEMANICPITSKTNFFFNSWTLFSSLAELLKHLTIGENKIDIILIDRNIFDSICWFHWLSTNPNNKITYISFEQYKSFLNFIFESDMWTKNIDLVYIFKTNPEDAMKREFSELLTTKTGSIMNRKVLESYNKSIEHIKTNYASKFRKVVEYDTSNKHPNIVGLDVTNKTLEVLKELLTEKIGYMLSSFVSNLKEGINDFEIIKNRSIFFDERHNVEENDEMIQPIAIAIITDVERKNVLVLKKNEIKTTRDSPEFNRMLLYSGGHIRQEDRFSADETNLVVIKRALQREIKEELNECISIGNQTPFLIYSPISKKSKKHLAVCFIIEMDLENKKFKPTRDEFIHKSSTSKSGTVVRTKELNDMVSDFEPWSLSILSFVFNLNRTLFS
jgi:thymidylate kinase